VSAEGLLWIAAAYFIGGIPVGYLVGKSKGIDIRQIGSGNIGASNVLRILGVKAGMAVWVADVMKGFLPTWAEAQWQPEMAGRWWLAATGTAVIMGHCFSPYLRLRGGRGVSTILGIMLALNWKAAVTGFGIWLVIVSITRYISLGSIVASLSGAPLLVVWGSPAAYWPFVLFAGMLITWRHTPNIRRLLAGTESKIGQRVKEIEPTEGAQENG